MAVRKALDRQPGPVPEIRADGNSVTFRLEVSGTPAETRLVLRCGADGEVWAAIAKASPGRKL
jgi:hypothetical protein